MKIAGLGILQVRHRAARMDRDPAAVRHSDRANKKVAFRDTKELKMAIYRDCYQPIKPD